MKWRTVTADLTRPETLEDVCDGFSVVFHLAGDAHAIDRLDGDNERLSWRMTVEGTRALVDQSIKAGVNRFLFFSSVKAMGEGGEVCLDETSATFPVTSYGKAKREAEDVIMAASQRGLPVTILRLPMVYGPGCKGNLPRMIRAIARGRFPPLPETGNKRSMADVRDVVEAALLAATNPAAEGNIYIVTDGQVYSTRQMYEWISDAIGRPVPPWTMPLSLLRFIAHAGDVIGRIRKRRFIFDTMALEKLIGSAWYSSDRITRELGYGPVHSLMDSLPGMVSEIREGG
jgi:nucleoside-diphosphate-sugar epimerase